ncbi:MAG TPA: SDR family NAD(P)-dependent oxidoreductase [Paenirhodobacter sp.]
MTFTDKSVLVTGGANGIGLAIVQQFTAAGATAYAADIDPMALALSGLPTERRIRMDVRDRASVEAGIAALPALDILICAAGVSSMAEAAQVTDADWDLALETNLRGVFLANQIALRRFQMQGSGVILNISAMAGKIGPPLFGAYAASKAGVIGWTQSLAREVAPRGIRANVLCPGFTETDMQRREIGWDCARRQITADQVRAEYVALTPLGRIETVGDVAPVALFLCSSAAGFVTGQAVNVTGGACLI